MGKIWENLRIKPEDVLLDHGPWHRLLLSQLWIFLVNFTAFSLVYLCLDLWIDNPDWFHFLQYKLSHFFVIVVLAQVVVMVGFNWDVFKRVLAAFLYKTGSAENLAMARILAMGMVFVYLRTYIPEHLAPLADLPKSSRESLPMVGWLVEWMPVSGDLYALMSNIAMVASVFAAVGLFTRESLIVVSLALFYVIGVPNFFGKVNHSHFWMWWPVFLAFSPAGESLSVDALIQRLRGRSRLVEPHYKYGLPMKLVFLQLGMLYFFSGIGKLWMGGFEWVLSDNLVHLMRLEWLENYGMVPEVRLDRYPVLCRLLAGGVVFFELAYLFLILTPRFRLIAAFSAGFFHEMTAYFLRIAFPLLQVVNLLHLDWHAVVEKIGQIKPRWAAVILGYACYALLRWWSLPLGIAFAALALGIVLRWLWMKPVSTSPVPSKPLSKWVWYIGLMFLAGNFVFGLTQTSSWPFSAYPSYSFIRKGTVDYVWLKPQAANGLRLDIDALGQEEGYRKENILPLAERGCQIIREEGAGSVAFENHIQQFWIRLQEQIPALKASTRAEVVFQTMDTDPDLKGVPTQESKLGELALEEGEWVWRPR